jgi:hypothetical protein
LKIFFRWFAGLSFILILLFDRFKLDIFNVELYLDGFALIDAAFKGVLIRFQVIRIELE